MYEARNSMTTQLITRQQVIELAKKMPPDKLGRWYEYGLFIQSRPLAVASESPLEDVGLSEEIALWEAASDEDWLNWEKELTETV
jgi:hypothetical protein